MPTRAIAGSTRSTPQNVGQLQARLDLLDRPGPRAGGGAAGHQRDDVCGRALSQQRLRARRRHRRPEMELPAQAPTRRRRASPAATWSTAAWPMTTARSSSTRSTTTPSRSTPRPARRSGTTKLGDINQRRDHDHGAAGGEGQGAGRQQRRRDGRARLADRAGRGRRQDRLARLFARAPMRTC